MSLGKGLIAMVLLLSLPFRGETTLPVIDYSNLTQQIQMGLRQIQQLAQEINTYQTLLLQYKNQLLQATGISQAAQIYQSSQQTLSQVTGTVNMFRNGGSLSGFLQEAQNVNFWLSAPATSYSNQPASYWSTTQTNANAQMVKQIAAEESQLQSDAQALQRLQTQAGGVATQRQAIDLGNEMSGLMQKSLLAIRTLMVGEQQAIAARSGTVSNREAMQQAVTQQLFTSPNSFSDHQGWHP